MKNQASLNQTDRTINFWFCGGLLAILLVSIMSRDITRPFYGLHSWAEAHGAWLARVHLKYGLAYTKGLRTWAVGQPPTANPNHYLDHPQLSALINAAAMGLLGINEWSLRVVKIITSAASLLLFLRILKGLLDKKTTLLAGLFCVLFPLTGYFGLGGWVALFSFCAIWCYLVLIGALKDGPTPKSLHKWGLAASLFLMIQLSWAGFFYAFVIGSHYVFRCIHRKQFPEKTLLAILIIAPLSSLILDFSIMLSGYGWDISKIWELYKWRSAKGEMPQFLWGQWFAKLWELAVTNYTLPALLTAILYLTFGQLFVLASSSLNNKNPKTSRRLPQPWLFLMPGVLLLFVFKGLVWRHQYWMRPLSPFIAIAAALGVMLLADTLKKIGRKVSVGGAVLLVSIFLAASIAGTNYYYSIRWQPLARINMFKALNERIPPNKSLLSREIRPYFVNQHKSKGGHYRPEIAWYLDRDIEQATTLEEIEQKAATGKFSYYLIPNQNDYMKLINKLRQKYQYQFIRGERGEITKNGKFLKAGMRDHWIFDLMSNKVSSP